MGLLRAVMLRAIRFYQRWISPALPPSCRFYPTCSAYAVTSIERFGPVTGLRLASWRLLRCNPWNPGGIDHVPAAGTDGRPAPSPADHRPRLPAQQPCDASGPEHHATTSHTA